MVCCERGVLLMALMVRASLPLALLLLACCSSSGLRGGGPHKKTPSQQEFPPHGPHGVLRAWCPAHGASLSVDPDSELACCLLPRLRCLRVSPVFSVFLIRCWCLEAGPAA